VDRQGEPVPGVHVQLRGVPVAAVAGVPWAGTAAPLSRSLMSGVEPVTVRFPARAAGGLEITAEARDEADRPGVAQVRVFSAGERPSGPASAASGTLTLVPLHASARPGDTVELLVLSSVYPADGLLTVYSGGLVHDRAFQLDGPSRVLEIPVDEDCVPGVTVRVDLAAAGAETTIAVESGDRSLEVVVMARDARVRPGGQTELQLSVADPGGRPVMGAEVAVFAVQRSTESGGDPLPDAPTMLLDSDDAGPRCRRLVGGKDPVASASVAPAAARASVSRGDRTALFVPAALTDGAGTTTVTLAIPPEEGTWEIIALATDGGPRFGRGRAVIDAREPLVVSTSMPSVLTLGDRVVAPLMLHNRGVDPLTVEVALRAAGALLGADIGTEPELSSTGWRVTVPPRGQVALEAALAPTRVGTGQLQVAARSGSFAHDQRLDFEVRPPASTEAHARFGTLSGSVAVLPLDLPWDAWPQVGGLDVATSASDLLSLTDALVGLHGGGSGSTVELASRALALAEVHDVSEAFGAAELGGPLGPQVIEDVAALARLQQAGGGFSVWGGSGPCDPFVSIHAIHALAAARSAGFEIPWSTWTGSLEWLQDAPAAIPTRTSSRSAWAMRAYALRVRQLMDDPDVSAAQALLVEAGHEALPLEASGWLLPLLAAGEDEAAVEALVGVIEERALESATTAHLSNRYSDGPSAMWYSDRRTDGVVLSALLDVAPDHPLVPRLAAGLLARQQDAASSGFQENVFTVLALHRLLRVSTGIIGFRSRVWLGQGLAREHMFRGERPIQAHVHVPMTFLDEADDEIEAVIGRTGAGTLRYRVGLSYAARESDLPAREDGISLHRRYEPVDDPADVTQDADGRWRVRAGARVRVRLFLGTTVRRYHVVVAEPLPAGLEPLALEHPPGFDHLEVRDGQILLAAPAVGVGLHEISYVAQATTAGTVSAPRAEARVMLDDGMSARSRGDWLVVQ